MNTAYITPQAILPFYTAPRQEQPVEYFFLIPPDMHLAAEVNELKRNLGKMYGFPVNNYIVPHIELFKFVMFEHNESYLSDLTRTCLSRFSAHTLKVDGFGTEEFRNSIYLHLNRQEPVQKMQKELRTLLLRNKRIHPDGRSFPFSPNIVNLHIPIVKGLEDRLFEKVKPEMEVQEYNYKLKVEKIILLKKRPEQKSWSVLKEFSLKGD